MRVYYGDDDGVAPDSRIRPSMMDHNDGVFTRLFLEAILERQNQGCSTRLSDSGG